MPGISRIFLSATALLALAGPAFAEHIKVEEAEAEMMEGEAARGDIFMRIINTGDRPDRLYAVRTPVAAKAKLENKSEQEVLEGQEQQVTSFLIKPGQTLELSEEGAHIELFGLKKQFESGESFPATLFFEQDGPVSVTVTVEEE
jgi:copper(I)-binding protein